MVCTSRMMMSVKFHACPERPSISSVIRAWNVRSGDEPSLWNVSVTSSLPSVSTVPEWVSVRLRVSVSEFVPVRVSVRSS